MKELEEYFISLEWEDVQEYLTWLRKGKWMQRCNIDGVFQSSNSESFGVITT